MLKPKKLISILLSAIMLMSLFPALGITASAANAVDVWTDTSYINVLTTETKPANFSTTVSLVMAKNEFESGQVVLRNTAAFNITGVSFTDLVSGSNTISNSNIKFNFVEYAYLSAQIGGAGPWSGPTPGYFPDALSNLSSISVAANTAQPIWVTVYAPKDAVPATYTSTMTITTSLGTCTAVISVEVNNVTIPDSANASFKGTSINIA